MFTTHKNSASYCSIRLFPIAYKKSLHYSLLQESRSIIIFFFFLIINKDFIKKINYTTLLRGIQNPTMRAAKVTYVTAKTLSKGSKNKTTTQQQRYNNYNKNKHKQYNNSNTDRHIIWPPSRKVQEQLRLSIFGATEDLES
jgi:hypothetical protein